MKVQPSLVASLCIFTAVLALNANAASTTASEAIPETGAAQDQSPKAIKPHSHMEEKTGMVSKVTQDKKDSDSVTDQPKLAKTNPWKDKSRHFHPRDGK